MMINTTHGAMEDFTLARTLGFEDRPHEFVIWVEWRLVNHLKDCHICQAPDAPVRVNGTVLVRRDAHVILKDASVVADAIAANLQGGV